MSPLVFAPFLSLQLIVAVAPGKSMRATVCHPPDAELVQKAKEGDRRSQGILYRRYAPQLARRAARLLGANNEAEDVLQDAFVEAFRDLHQLQDPDRFSHWLMRIATHQIHRRFRKRALLRRLGIHSYEECNLESLVDPGASPELRAQCAQLDKVLSSLPPGLRLAWTLRYVEGCQLEEIAACVEASLATVKRRIQRAQQRVQEHFSFALFDGDEDAHWGVVEPSLKEGAGA